MDLYNKIEEAKTFIRSRSSTLSKIGIVLGTGLGPLAGEIEIQCEISYDEIPYFPKPTVQSHEGKLIFGTLSGVQVLLMSGRFHYYEGYSMQEVTFPIRVLSALGIELLILSNVAGGLQAEFQPGDLVFLKDHINLMPDNPLRGPNDDRLGLRFPDMLDTYDRSLNSRAIELCKELDIPASEGVYAALQGPNLETPAEYNYLHTIGADLVGMSTVPEVLVARHMNMKLFVISIVSNTCYPIEELTPTTLEEVISVANLASKRLSKLMIKFIPELAEKINA